MRYISMVLRSFVSLKTFLILLIMCLIILVVYKLDIKFEMINKSEIDYGHFKNSFRASNFNDHKDIVDSYYEKRRNWKTSNLGSILFKINLYKTEAFQIRQKRTYLVLIWKHWEWLKNRHVHYFNKNKPANDPLNDCSVKNCKFTGNDDEMLSADAVVIHVQMGVFPHATERDSRQRWIFLNDESPLHSFSLAKTEPKISQLVQVFNWSMTYRSESDVPVPYGRTIPLQKPLLSDITEDTLSTLVPYWNNKRRDVLATILMSHCGVPLRTTYLQELEQHLTVDMYGKCSKNHKKSCPGHFRDDCKLMSEYLFYLVFENSQCEEYLTEKSFYHAYSKGAIPVILGPTKESCEKLLPPESFLHIGNYDSAQSLAIHIIEISKDDKLILGFHRWRNDFAVVNEHGYFGSKSYHLCRICEALNYNDENEKVYDEKSLKLYFDPTVSCEV